MRYKTLFLLVIVIIISLYSCNNKPEILDNDKVEQDQQDNINIDNNVEDDLIIKGEQIVTRALAAKMIALVNYDKDTIRIRDREIDFTDTSKEIWFDKYINTAVIDGWLNGNDKLFNPLKPLVYSELDKICQSFNVNKEEIGLNYTQEDMNTSVHFVDWMKFYKALLVDYNDVGGISNTNIIVFATPANNSELNAWEMATNKGIYSFEGLTVDAYMDKEIQVIVRGNEIIAVEKIVDTKPSLTNAYVKNISNKKATVFMGGVTREIELIEEVSKEFNGIVADLVINQGKIASVSVKDNLINDRVLLVSGERVELENVGVYSVDNDVKVYSLANGVSWKGLSNVIVGYNSADFIIDQGKICAVLINETVPIENIRVVINDTGYRGLYHQNVIITSNSDYTIDYGHEKIEFKANQELDVDKFFDNAKEDRLYIIPNNENSKVTINSIERGYGSAKFKPSYRGIIEIAKTNEGYLIVNEVPFEAYLYAVVPSEMPTSYGLEAAKVQAVSARSYAYTQFYSNRYSSYGAHVDDSVSCQVYNNIPENEISIRAVNETAKLALTYKSNVVSANFFSTSAGYTANSGDVWSNYRTKEFPTSSPEYLQAVAQFDGNKYNDLSKEENFRAFIKDNTIKSYDSDFAWYRWSVELTREQIEKSINHSIGSRYNAQPKLIKTVDENNLFRSRPIESIGEFVDILSWERGEGGNLTEMIIQGTDAIVKVYTEYNIRKLIAPYSYTEGESIAITRQDGSTTNNMSLMPSSFYIMDKIYDENNRLTSIKFYGGGYGHGVGMSQNGVKGMVDLGYTFKEILTHYYKGTEVKEVY